MQFFKATNSRTRRFDGSIIVAFTCKHPLSLTSQCHRVSSLTNQNSGVVPPYIVVLQLESTLTRHAQAIPNGNCGDALIFCGAMRRGPYSKTWAPGSYTQETRDNNIKPIPLIKAFGFEPTQYTCVANQWRLNSVTERHGRRAPGANFRPTRYQRQHVFLDPETGYWTPLVASNKSTTSPHRLRLNSTSTSKRIGRSNC